MLGFNLFVAEVPKKLITILSMSTFENVFLEMQRRHSCLVLDATDSRTGQIFANNRKELNRS